MLLPDIAWTESLDDVGAGAAIPTVREEAVSLNVQQLSSRLARIQLLPSAVHTSSKSPEPSYQRLRFPSGLHELGISWNRLASNQSQVRCP